MTADLKADVNRRVAALFAAIDDYDEPAFLAAIDALADELPEADADALFHRASARDSWGHSDLAVPLYRKALDIDAASRSDSVTSGAETRAGLTG